MTWRRLWERPAAATPPPAPVPIVAPPRRKPTKRQREAAERRRKADAKRERKARAKLKKAERKRQARQAERERRAARPTKAQRLRWWRMQQESHRLDLEYLAQRPEGNGWLIEHYQQELAIADEAIAELQAELDRAGNVAKGKRQRR